MERYALLSVSDRTGLAEFAGLLKNQGYTLLTTSGTAKFLTEVGIASTLVEQYTGQDEILGGRVKTLHPKIHAGLLAKRDNPQHMQELNTSGMAPIDIAVVNLYPFVEALKGEAWRDPARMIELIDIGGPTMIRAAAKNFQHVLPLIDPQDYAELGALILKGSAFTSETLDIRRKLALKVFKTLASYNLEIAKYLSHVNFEENHERIVSSVEETEDFMFGAVSGVILEKEQDLRYGENPHQKGSFYLPLNRDKKSWEKLHGKELSYNNFLDMGAAMRLVKDFELSRSNDGSFAGIIKHTNPCGAARASSMQQALVRAKQGDPRSFFGGIVAFNNIVTAEVAEEIRKDFYEMIIAPGYKKDALVVLETAKNLRVIKANFEIENSLEFRSVAGGFLLQRTDGGASRVAQAKLMTTHTPSNIEVRDLEFAWKICAHVKSNGIVIAKDEMLIGVGAGQMSRVDSVELALHKAQTHGHEIAGSVAASDAFFPFPDGLERMAEQGVKAVIVPSGAKRDEEIVAVAQRCGVALFFAPDRHFRH